jgi:hypothetical protein
MVFQEQYEGVLFWRCSACAYRWHAWSHEAAPKLHALAAQYIHQ